MNVDAITRSITEIGELARASGANVEKQLGEFTEYKKSTDQRILDLEQKTARALRDGNLRGGEPILNIAKEFVESDEVTALRAGKTRLASVSIKHPWRIIAKSLITNPRPGRQFTHGRRAKRTVFRLADAADGAGSKAHRPAEPAAPADRRRDDCNRASRHRDTNAAAAQSYEGAAKAESQITFGAETLALPTVATFSPVSRQVLSDVSTLMAFVSAWLMYFALQKFESLIISGAGDDTDKILGLTNAGVLFGADAQHSADRILQAALIGLPANGYSCGLIIMSTNDLYGILSARTTQEAYVGGGWSSALGRNLWDFPVAPSPGCPVGTAIVLDPAMVQILDREEVIVSLGFVGGQFTEIPAQFSPKQGGRWPSWIPMRRSSSTYR